MHVRETRLWDGFREKHAYERPAYETAAYEIAAYKRHAYEMVL
jgi:ribosomal protein S21